MFLENEKVQNKATNYYRIISILESHIFQYIISGIVFLHIFMFLALVENTGWTVGVDNIFPNFLAILFENGLIYLFFIVARKNEIKFNKLINSGIVLNTKINHERSRRISETIYIFSDYICEDGTNLVFKASGKLNPIRQFDLFTDRKLRQESHINVLVNPVKCSEYYIMIDEIGIKPEKKFDVPYANKVISIVLIVLLLIEDAIWIFCI